jgi:thiamine biosynthesis lipoprotein
MAKESIQARLDEINASMSTYRDDSEISRLNASPLEEWFPVSTDFLLVLQVALQVGSLSDGAYDVTVGPLVNIWGFGPGKLTFEPPDDATIRAAQEKIGQQYLSIDNDASAVKKTREVTLDFSSLAKGFAVDEVASLLKEQGIQSYLIEIGGEMKLAGLSARGDKWRVGIERPSSVARDAVVAISLTDAAVATSGDYRNYFDHDGQRYSHSIDPRTGYPVAHDLVSVTVVNNSAMLADAWATALIVLGFEAASERAQRQDLAVYFIRRSGDNYIHSHTDAFSGYLVDMDSPAASIEDGP